MIDHVVMVEIVTIVVMVVNTIVKNESCQEPKNSWNISLELDKYKLLVYNKLAVSTHVDRAILVR